MPFGMSGYAQSVVLQGRVYIGGGDTGRSSTNSNVVMEYDTCSGEWTTLPPYQTCGFAMVVSGNQLVLVGGCDENGDESKVLGVWSADLTKWTHPFPEMPTARTWCSVVVCKEWLVVAGGWADAHSLSVVEVLSTDTKQWHAGPPTPTPWYNLKTAVIGNTGYFMGGHNHTGSAIKNVYHVNIETLGQSSKPLYLTHCTHARTHTKEGMFCRILSSSSQQRFLPSTHLPLPSPHSKGLQLD